MAALGYAEVKGTADTGLSTASCTGTSIRGVVSSKCWSKRLMSAATGARGLIVSIQRIHMSLLERANDSQSDSKGPGNPRCTGAEPSAALSRQTHIDPYGPLR